MKAISRAIDRFCLKHSRFGIPRLMMYVVPLSALVFIFDMMDTTGMLLSLLAFHPGRIMSGEVWRLVTWIFLPLNDSLLFTALMLIFYYSIGTTLERVWGTPKFTIYYISGVLFNIIYGFAVWIILSAGPGSGPIVVNYLWLGIFRLAPNFLNLSMFFAYAALFPDHVIRFYFILPIKIKWAALVNAGFFAFSIISNAILGRYATAFLPVIALFNFILICGYDMRRTLRPAVARPSHQAINFKRAAKNARREYDGKPFRHQCAVCGKTDADHPELEFRYCSRCNGYHCFCADHISNHIHFQ